MLYRLACLPLLAAAIAFQGSAAGALEGQTNRIAIVYEAVKNPAHQPIYDAIKRRQALEKIQMIFSPFRLPEELTLKATGCDGLSNAWYLNRVLTICYEYLADIQKMVPSEANPAGITADDAMVGQFFYVVAHEMGHAMFEQLSVPLMGRAEDAADQFAAYMMLQFGKDMAHNLISGAAYTYKDYVEKQKIIVQQDAFADVHGAPMQRFYNLLCIAYGYDSNQFSALVEKGYLPQKRAGNCRMEYLEVNYAFRELINPHLDEAMATAAFQAVTTSIPTTSGVTR